MPRKFFNDGQEIIEEDLGEVSSVLEIELFDRLIYELMNRQQDVLFGDSLVCSNVNATTSQVKAGNGVQYDSAQVNPEPKSRLLYLASNTNVTHAAADGAQNRIDIICAKADRDDSLSESRNYKDPGSGAITSQTMVVQTDWEATLLVVAGTPGASPAVPSTPAGYIKLAEVLVVAATGIAGPGGYTDKRSVFKKASSQKAVTVKTAAYTIGAEDECVVGNMTGGAFAFLLPSPGSFEGREITVAKSDSSSNALTLTGTVNGEVNPTIDTQHTVLTMIALGGVWYWK